MKDSMVRQLLERYGDREDVRRNLHANYGTEGWIGPESAHYADQLAEAQRLMEQETSESAKRWLEERVHHLDDWMRRAQIAEERDEL